MNNGLSFNLIDEKNITLMLLIGLGLTMLCFLYIQPIYFNLPIYYDSGVFAYIGSVINSGGLPYVDAFDHKGLFVYLFNSIGLMLFNGEFRGIYVLELSLLVISLIVALIFIKKIVRELSVNIAISFVALIATYGILFEGGNLPETITFPWQLGFYSFSAYVLSLKKPERLKVISLAMIALLVIFIALFTRPNNAIGILTMTAILCLRLDHIFFRVVLFVGLLISGIVLYQIQLIGLFHDLLSQYLQYNFYYSTLKLSLLHRLANCLAFLLFIALSPSGFFLIIKIFKNREFIDSVVFLYTSLRGLFFWRGKFDIRVTASRAVKWVRGINLFYIFFFITFCDIFSQLVSGRFGRGYLHYGVIALPGLFISTVFFLQIYSIKQQALMSNVNCYLHKIFTIVVVFGSVVYFNIYAYDNFYKYSEVKKNLNSDIRNNSAANDKIYVSWADAWVYVMSERMSFTRYFYPNPIWHTAFDGRDRVGELLEEYKRAPPVLLVVWKSPTFEDAFSIKEIRERLMADYRLKISNKDYAIYVKNTLDPTVNKIN